MPMRGVKACRGQVRRAGIAERAINDGRIDWPFMSSIDPENAVPEHDETNNAIYFLQATAPASCTPGPTRTPQPAPVVVIDRAECWRLFVPIVGR